MMCRISHADFGEDHWWVIRMNLTVLDAELDEALPLLSQFAQIIPSLCVWDGNFQQPAVDFVHINVLSKSWLDEEDVLDFVLYAEVMLQSLQEHFSRDATLYP